jgi:effector-binding domain-containing protein
LWPANGGSRAEVIEMSECASREFGPLTCAVLAMRGPFDQMPAAFGRLYAWLSEKGHTPQGMPMAVYLNNPAEVAPADALWDLWAPIENEAEASGPDDLGFAIKRIPAMTVATYLHRGPYDQVAPAYARLMAWIAAEGMEVAGPPMEAYLNDPSEVSPEDYLTEIIVPVRK